MAGARHFSLSLNVQVGSEDFREYRKAVSRGVKRPGREADRLPPSTAEVKNEWRCASTLDIFVHAVCSKHVTVLFVLRRWTLQRS